MAITLTSSTPIDQGVSGRRRWKVWQVSGPSSYVTGGTTFTPSEVALSRIFWTEALTPFYNGTNMVNPQFPPPAVDGSQNMIFQWTSGTVNTAHAQVANGTNLSAYTGLIKVWGS